MVDPRLRPGSLLLWIMRRFFLALVVADFISPLIRLTDLFWTVLWVVLGLPDWFRKVYFSSHSQVRLSLNLPLAWVSLGVEVVSPRLSSEHGFQCCSLCPLVSAS